MQQSFLRTTLPGQGQGVRGLGSPADTDTDTRFWMGWFGGKKPTLWQSRSRFELEEFVGVFNVRIAIF